jgi:hypothetical protein
MIRIACNLAGTDVPWKFNLVDVEAYCRKIGDRIGSLTRASVGILSVTVRSTDTNTPIMSFFSSLLGNLHADAPQEQEQPAASADAEVEAEEAEAKPDADAEEEEPEDVRFLILC